MSKKKTVYQASRESPVSRERKISFRQNKRGKIEHKIPLIYSSPCQVASHIFQLPPKEQGARISIHCQTELLKYILLAQQLKKT